MPGTVTVPSTLSGHAAEIWRKAFLSAYDGTCSERDDKDECAAKVAWSAVKKGYKKNDKDQWVAKAGDPVIGPISTNVDNQPPLAYDKDTLKPGAGTKMQRWKAAYNKALAEDCRQSDNPTECARAYANKAVGRVETDVEPVEKVKPNGRVIKRIEERGGAGSGHFEHEGRPGEKGGSKPGKGGGRKPKRGEPGYNQPGSGTGHYERGEGYIGPDKPAKTGKESSARAKKAGLKPGEHMPKANTLEGDERKKWVKALATTNTLDQLRKKQSDLNEQIGKLYAETEDKTKDNPEMDELRALEELYTNAVMYQNFPETRSKPTDPFVVEKGGAGSGHHGREEGAKYPFFRIKGGPGSGHRGHEGRPGEVGGSLPGSGGRGGFSSPRNVYTAQDAPPHAKSEMKISGVLANYAEHHGGSALLLEAWDKAKKHEEGLRAGIDSNFNEPLASRLINILEKEAPFRMSVPDVGPKGEKASMEPRETKEPVDNPKDAKSATADVFSRFGVPHGKMSARYVSFMDLARGGAYNVTVKDIDWQKWLDAGPKEIKAALPKGMILTPEFINTPPGVTIVRDDGADGVDPLQVFHGRTEGATYPFFRIKGGEGSGHHGHRGRIGEVGGSEPGTGGGSRAKRKLREDTDDSDLDRGYDRAEQEYGPFGDPYEPVIDWMSVPDVGEKGKEVKYQREDPLGYDKENPPEPTTFPFEPSEYEKEMDGRRRHKFITKEIEKQLPALYSQENNPDPTVYAKWFHPYATQEWYATEYDPNEGMFFGWVNSGQDSELGYFSRQELAEVNVRGIPIERDLYFRPARLSEVKESARRQISQEEYGFRLGSVLRGEEKTMDEHPLKTRIKKDVMDAYEKRSEVRERLNDVDYALIERMGDQEIIRPDRFSTITWRTMPPSQKNVRSEATRRIIERNYAQAVEDAQINGWRAKINHYAPEEYYFVKPHDTDIGRVIMRAVLVRNEDSVDWELKTLSQFATESIAVQLPKGILRHNKEQLLKIPVIRGGPGSGHHGHRGRVGEVGGSEPGSGGSSSRPSAEMSDWAEMVAAENEEKRIAASLQADVESASSEELEAAGTIYDQLAGKPAAKAPVAERLPELSLSEIAREIRKDWSKQGKGVNYAAKPYLEAMASLESISDNYMFDSGESVVAYFLGNATTWKGDTARAVKKELNKRLKAAR